MKARYASVVPDEVEPPTSMRYKRPEYKKFMKPLTAEEAAKRKEEERGTPLPPPEVLVTERVNEILVKELPRVYGIPKKDMDKTITYLHTYSSALRREAPAKGSGRRSRSEATQRLLYAWFSCLPLKVRLRHLRDLFFAIYSDLLNFSSQLRLM